MIKAEIITCNSEYENGKCIGSYHESHYISHLNGRDHLIEAVRNIITNNLKYACYPRVSNTILKSVMIGCNDHHAVDYIKKNLRSIFPDCPYLKINICVGALSGDMF